MATDDPAQEVATRVREAVRRWHDKICNDSNIIDALAEEDDQALISMGTKFEPVDSAVQGLIESLERSAVHPDLISEVGDVLDIMMELCMRAACSDPSSSTGGMGGTQANTRPRPRSLGIAIQSTALGRRPSASYRMFDRLGGWETLSAAVDGVYRGLMKDMNMTQLPPDQEQKLKTNMLEIMTAALASKHLDGGSNPGLWMRHNEVVALLGLPPTYFDSMLEHLQSTLDELGLPHDDIQGAIAVLKSKRDAAELGMDGEGGDRFSWAAGQHRNSLSGRTSRLGRAYASCSGSGSPAKERLPLTAEQLLVGDETQLYGVATAADPPAGPPRIA